jgi:hypothetical protein
MPDKDHIPASISSPSESTITKTAALTNYAPNLDPQAFPACEEEPQE